MSVRSTAFAAIVLAIALVCVSGAPAAKRPPRDQTPPTKPTNLRITASSATSISLAWSPSSDNSSNWWYCVQVEGAGCYRVNPPQTTFTHPKLAPGRTTTWSVVALDAAGNRSASSNSVTFTTPPDTTPPSPVPVLTATAVYPTRVSLSWTASADNTSQVWYTLLVDGSPYGADLIGYRGVTVLDLKSATTHTFKVTVRDQYRNTAESSVLSVTTPAATDTVAPTTPTNLRLSSESAVPEIWLDWDQSTDDTDPQSLLLYDVYLNGEPEHAAVGSGQTIVYCRGEGPNTISIKAVDTSGNESGFSNQIVFC